MGDALEDLQRSTQALSLAHPSRRVVCAANRVGDVIAIGIRHGCPLMRINMRALGIKLDASTEQGFVDQLGTFLTREEAMRMALGNGQHAGGGSCDILFSEDIY